MTAQGARHLRVRPNWALTPDMIRDLVPIFICRSVYLCHGHAGPQLCPGMGHPPCCVMFVPSRVELQHCRRSPLLPLSPDIYDSCVGL